MTNEHTPGPWKVSAYKVGMNYKIESDPATTTKWRLPNREFVAMAPSEANASLIASAPDLLAALEAADDVLDQVLDSTGYELDQNQSELVAAIRAAIAKAKGNA